METAPLERTTGVGLEWEAEGTQSCHGSREP